MEYSRFMSKIKFTFVHPLLYHGEDQDTCKHLICTFILWGWHLIWWSERFLRNQLLKLISNFMWKPSAAATILLLQFQGSEQDESRLSINLTSNWIHIYHIYMILNNVDGWCEYGRVHKINLQSSASGRVGAQNILFRSDRFNPIPSIQEMNFKCNSRPTIYQFYCTMCSSYSTELCVWAF